MERLVCALIGYACGLLQTGYLYGKLNHIDIRNHGSGNSGTTNALRTLGFKAGLITFLGDFLKCIVAAVIVHLIFGKSMQASLPLLYMYAGMGAVLGHNYPFYLGFKGGKGIAVTAGLFLVTNPWIALTGMAVFLVVTAITKYVSVASLVLVVIFVIEVVVYGQYGGFGLEKTQLMEMYTIAVLLMCSAFYKHRENIKRLLNGTENKLKLKKS